MTPSTALVAYAESLLDGRRVVVFGDCSTTLADELIERGARVVHVFDEDAARVGETAAKSRSRNISYAPLADVDVAVRDGAFDVALVPNLIAFSDRAQLVKRVQRALSTRGVALFAAPNPEVKRRLFHGPKLSGVEPLSYYDLYDLVSVEFDEVRMLGQTPFIGYAVVDFAQATEPDVSFDSGFVPGGAEEPEWYVAVASARAVELEAFMVIQLPAALARPITEERSVAASSRIAALEALVAERDAAIAELERRAPSPAAEDESAAEANLAALRAQLFTQERESARLTSELESRNRDVERVSAELVERDTRIALLNNDLAERDAELMERDGALTTQQAALERLRVELTEREDALAKAHAQYAALELTCQSLRNDLKRLQVPAAQPDTEQIDHLTQRIAELQTEVSEKTATLTARQEQIFNLEADLARNDAAVDYAALETALMERAGEIRRLQHTLTETERTGRDLVARVSALTRQLEDLRRPEGTAQSSVSEPAPISGPMQSLARKAAEREADLQAARWTIEELETLLEARDGPERAALSRQLAEARAELQRQEALLRQAERTGENPAVAR